MTIHATIGDTLRSFGGLLRCTVCGREEPLEAAGMGVGFRLRHGWPQCHGYTMTWLTENQLREESKGIR